MNSMFSDQVKQVMQLAREEGSAPGTQLHRHRAFAAGHHTRGQKYGRSGADKSEPESRKYQAIHRRFCRFFWQFPMTMGEVPFTPRAKQILEIAANEAKEMKSRVVRTSHLLLALLKDKDGVAAQILVTFGVDHRTAKEEVIAVLQGKSSSGRREKRKSKTPFPRPFRTRFNRSGAAGQIGSDHWSRSRNRTGVTDTCQTQKEQPRCLWANPAWVKRKSSRDWHSAL